MKGNCIVLYQNSALRHLKVNFVIPILYSLLNQDENYQFIILYLIRYNDYTHDPLSRCNCTPPYSAENAISARCDLNPANGSYPFGALGHRSHGGTDMKVRIQYYFD